MPQGQNRVAVPPPNVLGCVWPLLRGSPEEVLPKRWGSSLVVLVLVSALLASFVASFALLQLTIEWYVLQGL